jgi:hypothetical protein
MRSGKYKVISNERTTTKLFSGISYYSIFMTQSGQELELVLSRILSSDYFLGKVWKACRYAQEPTYYPPFHHSILGVLIKI